MLVRLLRVTPLLVVALVALSAVSTQRVSADGDVTLFDYGPQVMDDSGDIHNVPAELAIGLVGDCSSTLRPPACGDPPARWELARRPVEFCTYSRNRPSWLSAEQFRKTVEDAAAVWNSVEIPLGVRYTGDCLTGTRWDYRNGRNEIAFDDERNAVAGNTAAITNTLTTWFPATNPTSRPIREADIVIDSQFANSPRCFATTVMHELGHALGLAHSDTPSDLMFPTFSSGNVSTCHSGPSAAERARMQELYGVDRAPTVRVEDQSAEPGAAVRLVPLGEDAEDGIVGYNWTQLSGPAITLTPDGQDVTFTAPNAPGETIRIQITAIDRFLHTGGNTVMVSIIGRPVPAPSATAPALSTSAPVQADSTGSGTLAAGAIGRDGGFGLLVFGGGSSEQLVAASGCERERAVFWASRSGEFVTYVPGALIAAVNAQWNALFAAGLPSGTALIGKCG